MVEMGFPFCFPFCFGFIIPWLLLVRTFLFSNFNKLCSKEAEPWRENEEVNEQGMEKEGVHP